MENYKLDLKTIKDLGEFSTISGVIDYLSSLKPTYPQKPTRPQLLVREPSAKEALEYAQKLDVYESIEFEYTQQVEHYRESIKTIDTLINNVIKERAGLESIPEQYRQKVWEKAYDRGHSNGYLGVFEQLESLIEIFH